VTFSLEDFFDFFFNFRKVCIYYYFLKLNLILDIAWRVWPFDIPNEIKVFRINSHMKRAVN